MFFSHQDPFEEYKKRLAKKLAKQAEAEKIGVSTQEKPKDDINWFGTKVGSDNASLMFGAEHNGNVGKYLSLKRPQEAIASAGSGGGDETKKKRKIGFGNFEAW